MLTVMTIHCSLNCKENIYVLYYVGKIDHGGQRVMIILQMRDSAAKKEIRLREDIRQ